MEWRKGESENRKRRMNREEIISELKNGIEFADRRGYGGLSDTMMKAIKLIESDGRKRESFIVIDRKTGEEADTYKIALREKWAKHLCYCDMEGWAIEDDGTLLLVDECGRFAYADRTRFEVKWEVTDGDR